MGNQANKKFEWEQQFNILERNFNDNTLLVQKYSDGHQYIARQIISTDRRQAEEIKRLIKLKYQNSNPFLTKLVHVFYNNDEAYCSPEDKVHLVFEKPKQTLRQEILARKFAEERFTEEQADVILESGVKAIRSLKEMKHPHNNISTSSIFINEDRRILVGDPWITPPVYNQEMSQNVFACPSPQKILFQNDQIMSICPYRSDLFSIGTVVLEVLFFEHMDILYQKGFRRLIQSRVNQKLSKIKNEQLRFKLSIVLSHDPNNREEIYKTYRTHGLTSSHIKNNSVKHLKGQKVSESRAQMIKQKDKATSPIIYLSNNKSFKSLPKQAAKYLPQNEKANNVLNNFKNNNNTYKIYQAVPYLNNQPKIFSQQGLNPIVNIPVLPPYQSSGYKSNIHFIINSDANKYKPTQFKPSFTPDLHRAVNPQSYPFDQSTLNIAAKPSNPVVSGTTMISPEISQISKVKLDADSFEALTNQFDQTLIRKSDDFVKTSGNIHYMESEADRTNHSNEETFEKVDGQIQHIGNYVVKPTSFGTINKTESFDIKQTVKQLSNQSKSIPDKVAKQQYLAPSKVTAQKSQSKHVAELKSTPERRPNHKYNSTIKEDPNECSYSGSRDDEDYEYVIQNFEAGRFEGQKKNGMRNGLGKFYYNQGSVYDGYWRDNLMHGKGNLYYSNGNLAYQGDWRMDQFHGFGKVYNQDQLQIKGPYNYKDFTDVNQYWASYEGELNSDRRHGKGKIKFSNGQIFVGNFIADVADGQGKFYTLNGQIVHGVWRNNKLVKKL